MRPHKTHYRVVYYPVVRIHFVHTREFDRSADQCGFNDEALRAAQVRLCEEPTCGDVIPGTGGLRKLRVGVHNRGTRGGLRLIYFFAARRLTVYLLLTYPKSMADDLSAAGRRHLTMLARQLEAEDDV